MNFFDRLSKGWEITRNSFEVLGKNKQLLIFPVLSGLSMLLILGTLFLGFFGLSGWNFDTLEHTDRVTTYAFAFVYYLVNYFIVVFFNMALVHCTKLYYDGEEVSVQKGLQFSMSRIGAICSWALLAATVGTVLKAIQENVGIVGKLITGLVGIVWNVATFFVVPILAYEKIGPVDALKRSSQMMKEKWGESLGSGFSMGIIGFLMGTVVIGLAVLTGFLLHPVAGVVLGVTGFLLISAVMSAAQTIFVSTVYQNMTGSPTPHFNERLLDDLFVRK